MLTSDEIKELAEHVERVSPRYGFEPHNTSSIVSESTADMFLIIGLENRMMCKSPRSNLFVAKIGANKMLRSIHHRIFSSTKANLEQNFYSKELITLDMLIFKLMNADDYGIRDIRRWSLALRCITFVNVDDVRFKIQIGMIGDVVGCPTKYHWLSIAVDKNGEQTAESKALLHSLGYKLITY